MLLLRNLEVDLGEFQIEFCFYVVKFHKQLSRFDVVAKFCMNPLDLSSFQSRQFGGFLDAEKYIVRFHRVVRQWIISRCAFC